MKIGWLLFCLLVIGCLTGCKMVAGEDHPLPSSWPLTGFNFPAGTKVRQVTDTPGYWYLQLDCPGGWAVLSAHTSTELAKLGYKPVDETASMPGQYMALKSADGEYLVTLQTSPKDTGIPDGVVKGNFWFTLQSKEHAEQYR